MIQHEAKECPLRPVDCKFGCGTTGLQGWRLDRHYVTCPKRQVYMPRVPHYASALFRWQGAYRYASALFQAPCHRCNQLVSGEDLAAHNGKFLFGKALVCDQLRISCPLKCGTRIFFKDKEFHFGAGGCVHAKIGCEQCGVRLRRIDLSLHLETVPF